MIPMMKQRKIWNKMIKMRITTFKKMKTRKKIRLMKTLMRTFCQNKKMIQILTQSLKKMKTKTLIKLKKMTKMKVKIYNNL